MRTHSSPLSRRSSCMTDSSDSPRKGSDEEHPSSGIKVIVANWKAKGSVDCQVVDGGDAAPSFLRDPESGMRNLRDPTQVKQLRASIAVCADSHPPSGNIQMRQRALTVSGDGCREGASLSRESPTPSPLPPQVDSNPQPHPVRASAQDVLKVLIAFYCISLYLLPFFSIYIYIYLLGIYICHHNKRFFLSFFFVTCLFIAVALFFYLTFATDFGSFIFDLVQFFCQYF